MSETTYSHIRNSHATKIWLGIAAGAAIGLGIALTRRRKKSRWETACKMGERLSERSGEAVSEAAADIVGRVKVIYEEGKKVAENAGELWAHGRKVAGV